MCQQIYDNALIQQLYCFSYIHLLQQMLTLFPKHMLDEFLNLVNQTRFEMITKINAKGFGKMLCALYTYGLWSSETMETTLLKWLKGMTQNECPIAELLVTCFNAFTEEHRKDWKHFALNHVQPYWDGSISLTMRAKICLWDIRDIYA